MMCSGEDNLPDKSIQLSEGSILVWRVRSTDTCNAMVIAAQMGETASRLGLGGWAITPGADEAQLCYFDLVLSQDVDPVLIRLAFETEPDIY